MQITSPGHEETPSVPEAGNREREERELPLSVTFEILSNERRRRVLRYLLNESDTTTLGELAEHIASLENDKPQQDLNSAERKRVYICLYQCHLPKLDDADIIAFEEHRKTVSIGPNLRQLTRFLPSDDGNTGERGPKPEYYLGISFLGFGSLTVHSMLYPATWLSGLVLGSLLAFITALSIRQLSRSWDYTIDRHFKGILKSTLEPSDG